MKSEMATLGINEKKYSVFQFGDIRIKFYTSPYLQKYCKINKWSDEGYIEYEGAFSTTKEIIKDTIDLKTIAKRLHLSDNVFKGIKGVQLV